MFSSILVLYSLDASSMPSLVVTTKNCQILPPLGGGSFETLPTDESQGEACLLTSVVVDAGY